MPISSELRPATSAPLREIETERLALRRFRRDDLDTLAAIFARPEVRQYPYRRGLDRDETRAFLEGQMAEWDSGGFGLWLATLRETGQTIGYVGLSVPVFLPEILPAVEVGWRFDPAAWGRGYASEGARAALREAFTSLGLHDVCPVPQAANPASSRVCERIGMRLERTVTIPANERRGALGGLLYRMTRREWLARQPEA